jgi:hypothetical protein
MIEWGARRRLSEIRKGALLPSDSYRPFLNSLATSAALHYFLTRMLSGAAAQVSFTGSRLMWSPQIRGHLWRLRARHHRSKSSQVPTLPVVNRTMVPK